MKTAFVPVVYGDARFVRPNLVQCLGYSAWHLPRWTLRDDGSYSCTIINSLPNLLILKYGRLSSRCFLPGGSHSRCEIAAMIWLGAEHCSGVDNPLSISTQLWATSALPCPEFFSNPWASYLLVLRNMGDYFFKFLAAPMPGNFPERAFVGLFEFWPHMTWTVINYCISNGMSPS